MSDFVSIKTFNHQIEAEATKSFLEANDISSYISADNEGGAYPFPVSPTTTGVKIFVRQEDKEKAMQLLEQA